METTISKRFACHVGLIGCPAGTTGIFIESPRTGARLVFWREWFVHLPARVRGRIAQAASRGVHRVEFTTEELKAIADASIRCPRTTPAVPGSLRYWGRRLDSRKKIARMRNVGH